jgi:hypothetical protein
MTAGSLFAATYAAARVRFLHACADAGAELAAHRHPLAGPDGGALSLDVARFGAAGARRVLFLNSGTHGVEGFCGSGLQTGLLDAGIASRLPADVALVVVHAVNPWGFAWLRRVNEDNVDLNRNFLAEWTAPPENPDYDRLAPALNPTRLDDAALARALERMRRLEREHGSAATYRALSGGQYRHPRGVQYGGAGPVWSNRTLRAIWARWAGDAEAAAFVDLHSGLGPCGVGLLFQTATAESAAARLAADWWPDTIRAEPPSGADAGLAEGLIGPAFCAALPAVAAAGVVLEFGTVDAERVVRAVIAENWLHHHGDRASAQGRGILAEMRTVFLPDDREWQDAVFARARSVVERAVEGLARFAPAAA